MWKFFVRKLALDKRVFHPMPVSGCNPTGCSSLELPQDGFAIFLVNQCKKPAALRNAEHQEAQLIVDAVGPSKRLWSKHRELSGDGYVSDPGLSFAGIIASVSNS